MNATPTGRMRIGLRLKPNIDTFTYTNDNPYNAASSLAAALESAFHIPWDKCLPMLDKLQLRKPLLIECSIAQHKEFVELLHAHDLTSILEDMYVQNMVEPYDDPEIPF